MLGFMHLIPDEQIHPLGITAFEVLVEAIAGIPGGVFLTRLGACPGVAGFRPERCLTAFASALAGPQPFLAGIVDRAFTLLGDDRAAVRAVCDPLFLEAL